MADPAPFLPVAEGSQPPLDLPSYLSTRLRHPSAAAVRIPATLTEASAPRFEARWYPQRGDLSVTDGKAAIGERIIVAGRVMDENGRAVRDAIAVLRRHQPDHLLVDALVALAIGIGLRSIGASEHPVGGRLHRPA